MTTRLRRFDAGVEPNLFASKPGATAIASTPPVRGSSTTALPPFAPHFADGVAQHGLRVRLDPVVDRQEDVVARPLRLRRDHVDHAAARIADRRLAAGLADERLVERALEPFEAVVVDPRVAEHLRGDAALRVVAQLLGVEPEPGQVELLQRRRLRRVGLPLDVDEVVRAVGERPGRASRRRRRAPWRRRARRGGDPSPRADRRRRSSPARRSRAARRCGRRSSRARPGSRSSPGAGARPSPRSVDAWTPWIQTARASVPAKTRTKRPSRRRMRRLESRSVTSSAAPAGRGRSAPGQRARARASCGPGTRFARSRTRSRAAS